MQLQQCALYFTIFAETWRKKKKNSMLRLLETAVLGLGSRYFFNHYIRDTEFGPPVKELPRAISIPPKLSKIWKKRQTEQKFLGKVSRNSGNCWIFEMPGTIQPKILEIPGSNFRKFGYTLWGCPLFWKFWQMLFHSLLDGRFGWTKSTPRFWPLQCPTHNSTVSASWGVFS